jgi:hypothetical protein
VKDLGKTSFYLLLLFAFTQIHSQKLSRATITSVGSATTYIDIQGKSLEIQQSIGQSSIIGTQNIKRITVQQGFLNTVKVFNINNSNEDFIDTSLNIIISPNPFIDYINIKFSKVTEHVIHIKIYDIQGKVLFSRKYNATASLSIPMKYYSAGSYLIYIQSGINTFSKKLLKTPF